MKIQLVTACLIIVGGLFAHGVMAAPQSGEPLDRIVATVNDTVITQSELQHEMVTIKRQLANSNTSSPSDNILHKQVLDQLINRKLQLQLAEQANITINDAEMNSVISNIAQSNKMTTEELYQKVVAQGMTKTEYRDQIRDEMTLQRIQQQNIGSKVNIAPKEIDAFMRSKDWQAYNTKEYRLEDIMVSFPDAPTSEQIAAAKKQADAILTKIHQGTSFHQAAMNDSNNSNALQGGDLGWRKLPEIPTAFANNVIHMKQNDILGPIQTANGFHIIHLAEVRDDNSHGNIEDQRKQVAQLIFQRKLEEALQTWVAQLRSSAYIELSALA